VAVSAGEVVVCAAIMKQGRLLGARRMLPKELAGQWELPGGKVQAGETDSDALLREIREELGVRIALRDQVGGDWPLGNGVLRVWLARCIDPQEPRPLVEHDLLRWLSLEELEDLPWLPADREPARVALTHWLSRGRTVG